MYVFFLRTVFIYYYEQPEIELIDFTTAKKNCKIYN